MSLRDVLRVLCVIAFANSASVNICPFVPLTSAVALRLAGGRSVIVLCGDIFSIWLSRVRGLRFSAVCFRDKPTIPRLACNAASELPHNDTVPNLILRIVALIYPGKIAVLPTPQLASPRPSTAPSTHDPASHGTDVTVMCSATPSPLK